MPADPAHVLFAKAFRRKTRGDEPFDRPATIRLVRTALAWAAGIIAPGGGNASA